MIQKRQTEDGIVHEIGSGNVYEDLGFPDADHMLLKSQLAAEIQIVMEDRGLTQAHAATIMGIPQSRVSDILRGKLSTFTIDRLLGILRSLDSRVRLVVERVHEQTEENPHPRRQVS